MSMQFIMTSLFQRALVGEVRDSIGQAKQALSSGPTGFLS